MVILPKFYNNYFETDNIDYMKRLIFLHILPKQKTGVIPDPSPLKSYHVGVMNLSSRTGQGKLMSSSERVQMTNVYYGYAKNLFLNENPIDLEDLRRYGRSYLNVFAPITFGDFSFSIHHYDMMRVKYGEQRVCESYSDDIINYRNKKRVGVPNPLYYCDEHQLYEIDNYDDSSYFNFVLPERPVLLNELMDERTNVVFVQEKENPEVDPENDMERIGEISSDLITTNTYRVTLESMNFALLNHIHYMVDTKMGTSGIQYSSKHILPKEGTTYRNDLETTIAGNIYKLWEFCKDMVESSGTDIRVMVDATEMFMNIKIIEYKSMGESDIEGIVNRYEAHIDLSYEMLPGLIVDPYTI